MRVGIIGAGRFGKNHVRTLHEMGVLEGVAELDDVTREKASLEFGVPTFSNYREMLTGVDAVVVATPAQTHFAIAREVILAGKPVLVEKPLTLSVEEGESLVALAQINDVPLMVGHLLIYQPAIQLMKQVLSEGLIGSVLSLHQDRLNLGKARSHENALWSLGVHDVAVLLYLLGESPVSSTLVGQSVLTDGVADDTFLHLTFASGVQAHVHNSWLWPIMRRCLTVVGTKGMLVFDELTKQVVLHRKSIDQDLNNVDSGSEVIFEGDSQPLRLELEHFVQCAQTGSRPISDGVSALEVLKVLEAAK